MNEDASPRPDGFSGFFYQFLWDVIYLDVINFIQFLFLTSKLNENLHANLLILILKITWTGREEDFCLITLANFQFKIITKILVDHLAVVAAKIISHHQRGFILDRDIAFCVIITTEAINILSKKLFIINISLKIDIKKVFDALEWNFLQEVLYQVGINKKLYLDFGLSKFF